MNLHVQGPIYNTKLYQDRVNNTGVRSYQLENKIIDEQTNQKTIDQYQQKLRSIQNSSHNSQIEEVRRNSFSYQDEFLRYQDDIGQSSINQPQVQQYVSKQKNLAETLLEVTDTKLPPGLTKRTIKDYKKKNKKENYQVTNEKVYEAYKHHSQLFQQQKNFQQFHNGRLQSPSKDMITVERRRTVSVKQRPSSDQKGSVEYYSNSNKIINRNQLRSQNVRLKPLQTINLNISFNDNTAVAASKEAQKEDSTFNQNKFFLTAPQKQKKIKLMPLTKIFFLNRINKFSEIKNNFINFDLSPFIFSNFKKEIQSSIDLEVLERAYPYIQKVLNLKFIDEFYSILSKNPEKKRDFEEMKLGFSKKDILKIFNDFETEYISEKKLFERVIYYFIPSTKQIQILIIIIYYVWSTQNRYRQQIVIDLIGQINNIGDNSFKNYQNIECIFDVNGREVTDILQLHFQTLILLGGEKETMKRNQFLRDLENFIEAQQNQQFRDTLKNKAQINFDTAHQVSQSPYDSPKKNRNNSISIKSSAQTSSVNEQNHKFYGQKSQSIYQENSISQHSFSQNASSPTNFHIKRGESRNAFYEKESSIMGKNSSNYKLNSILQEGSVDYYGNKQINTGIVNYLKRKTKSNFEFSKMKTKELVRIRNIYPQLTNKDIFRYYSEFQSLINLNEGLENAQNYHDKISKGSDLIYAMNFFTFCTSFKSGTHTPIINSILRAIGIDVEVADRNNIKLSWDKFLNLRVLMEQKGEKEHIVDFLQRLFDPKRIGIITKQEFLEILQTSEKLFNENGEEAKWYAHQMWSYFNKNNFMNEYVELKLDHISQKYDEHKYSYQFFLSWILNNFDESLQLELDNC
ncbi:hypothetical protein ABPG72_007578 [Tetrahymena utriculariae]